MSEGGPGRTARMTNQGRDVSGGQSAGGYAVESVGRAITVVDALANFVSPVTLSELVANAGMTKATTYRILRTLQQYGVARDAGGGRFVLGPTAIRWGRVALDQASVPAVAEAHARALSTDLDESVSVAVLTGTMVVIILRIEGSHALQIRFMPGSLLPAYCTSTGQVLLADLAPAALKAVIDKSTFGENGPGAARDAAELQDRLARVREQGYSVTTSELAVGTQGVAAPLRGSSGEAVAAINISIPTARMARPAIIAEVVPKLLRTADQISRELGWSGGSAAVDPGSELG